MQIYIQKNKKIETLKEFDFKLEKEIQNICEDNLPVLFGLEKVKSEFELNNLRIDTLAYDSKNKSFVIIEYKRNKNFSVIDQGFAYLSLLLNNKAEFILEYNENCNKNFRKKDIDWEQTRVIFISPFFTVYQKQSVNFQDLPMELWEIKKFDNDIIVFNQIEALKNSESIKTVTKASKEINLVSKQIKTYTENEHLDNANINIKEIYEIIKERVFSFAGNVRIKPRKLYIGFVNKTNFLDIKIQKKSLKVWLNLKTGILDDPKKYARDVSNIGHWGNGDYEINIENSAKVDFDYLESLIKQSYFKN